MFRSFLASVLLLSPAALAAQEAPVGLAQLEPAERLALRCGVAFGMIAEGQARGDPRASEYPAMQTRGREFFVRNTAALMEKRSLTQEQARRLSFDTLIEITSEGIEAREAMMPTCLRLLDESGL